MTATSTAMAIVVCKFVDNIGVELGEITGVEVVTSVGVGVIMGAKVGMMIGVGVVVEWVGKGASV